MHTTTAATILSLKTGECASVFFVVLMYAGPVRSTTLTFGDQRHQNSMFATAEDSSTFMHASATVFRDCTLNCVQKMRLQKILGSREARYRVPGGHVETFVKFGLACAQPNPSFAGRQDA